MHVGLCLALCLAVTQGCTRSGTFHPSDTASSAGPQSLPFHADTTQVAESGGASPAVAPDPKQPSGLPFRAGSQTSVLPAGTLITVQLGDSLSAAKARLGDIFTAAIAVPLKVDRDIVVESGTTVTGRVESVSPRSPATSPETVPRSGYLRLTLSAITVQGRPAALQTASLFARGTFQPSEGILIQKGRRLTFRLTTPLTVNSSNSVSNR
jgi:hypothetical protein